jgi:formylglycine-generating enzyme required for sulfatase activity
MKHTGFFAPLGALLVALALCLGACENPSSPRSGTEGAFAFTPVLTLREGETAAGMKAGDFGGGGTVALETDEVRGGDNGKFEISGAELLLKEALPGGPHRVLFRVENASGESLTHGAIIFVAFADGPTDIAFVPDYRLMTGAAVARGWAPLGAFVPAGGLAPYSYSLAVGAEGNDANNDLFRGGAEGIYARDTLEVGDYRIYVRCTASNGKFYEKALAFTVADYAPPTFLDERDFVRFERTTVNGHLDYESWIFTDGRNLAIPPFMLAKHETTQALWWDVYQWARKQGDYSDREGDIYTFVNQTPTANALPSTAPAEADKAKPQIKLYWPNIVLWLNAFSEKQGLTPVYYTDSAHESPMRSFNTDNANLAGTSIKAYTNPIYTNWEAEGFRLPCEAEWELAARGGKPSTDPGSPWMCRFAGTDNWGALHTEYAWTTYDTIGATSPSPVGLKLPNTAGLYDMTGNAREWCGDNYVNNLTPIAADSPVRGPIYDPDAPDTDSKALNHPVRGGDYGDIDYRHFSLRIVESAFSDRTRGSILTGLGVGNGGTSGPSAGTATGFRIARTIPAGQ